MKVIVLNKAFGTKQKDMIRKTAAEVNAEVYFLDSENDIPENLMDADVVYGFGVGLAQKSKNLKWLCVPSAVHFRNGRDPVERKDGTASGRSLCGKCRKGLGHR